METRRLKFADSPTLKRSFNSVTKSSPPSPDFDKTSGGANSAVLPTRPSQAERHRSFLPKRRQSSGNQSSNMPVAAGPQQAYQSFPSFRTVFGADPNSMESIAGVVAGADEKVLPFSSISTSHSQENDTQASLLQSEHKHRDSISTQASESTDSSPTTTISTADSSSLTDPSPSSSPESPITIIPLSSFSSSNCFTLSSLDDLTMSDLREKPLPLERPAPSLSLERPMTSPSPRRGRNAKGLALNLPSLSGNSSPELSDSSLPSSPSAFIKPPAMKPRKKASNLSLQTSANPAPIARVLGAHDPPPTPGFGMGGLTLRHAQSTPNIFSPGLAPAGGMRLPGFGAGSGSLAERRRPLGLSKLQPVDSNNSIPEEISSPITHQIANRGFGDNIGGDSFDRPGEENDHANDYPNGPACIFPPSVFLYKEPTSEEAAEFDVIINVASEIRNPFSSDKSASSSGRLPAPKTSFGFDDGSRRDSIPEPSTALSMASFQTAFEFLPDSARTPTESSPTTPKAPIKKPEYIHRPWEHNSDVAEDLLRMCEVIDDRVRAGKKVLIHCAQGISRSASLCISYAIYQNPSLTPTEAHEKVKEKSEWIQPNLKLLMQIQDFKKELLKRRSGLGGRHGRGGRSPTKHRNTQSVGDMEITREPMTAPLYSTFESEGVKDSPIGTPSRARGMSTPNFGDITPGPSSAPSSFAWTKEQEKERTFGMWPLPTFMANTTESTKPSSFGSQFGKTEREIVPATNTRSMSNSSVDSDSRPLSSSTNDSSSIGPSSTTTSEPKTNPFAGFDFGFGSKPEKETEVEIPAKQPEVSLAIAQSTPEKVQLAPDNEKRSSFKLPPMPGSFPSPGVESPLRTPMSGFGSRSPAFGSHRKGLRNSPSLPALQLSASKKAAPVVPFGSLENRSYLNDRKPEDAPFSPGLFSPRIQEMNANPLTEAFGHQSVDKPKSNDELSLDDLMSPRVTEFAANPFAMPRYNNASDAAASFGFATTTRETPLPPVVDPRSPPTKGEAPIIRSIDDML